MTIPATLCFTKTLTEQQQALTLFFSKCYAVARVEAKVQYSQVEYPHKLGWRALMKSKSYIIDRVLHWISALLLLFMLMNLASQLHNLDWDIKGQLQHRQDAVELHASVGIVLVVFTLARLLYPLVTQSVIERVQPTSVSHGWFIKITHIALYTCITLLAATGIGLINNYEIPLSVFGWQLAPAGDAFYRVFPPIHTLHLALTECMWWLIAIHFAGIMYAKR